MPNHPNNYKNMGLTGKNRRKQEKNIMAPLMVPFVQDETHEHGENIQKKENRINDQVKSGKRRGAMLLTDTHGLVIAKGSKEDDPWCKLDFPALSAITPV